MNRKYKGEAPGKGDLSIKILCGVSIGAFVCALILFIGLMRIEKRANAKGETVEVQIATETLFRGENGVTIVSKTETVKAPTELVPEGYLSDTANIKDMYLVSDVSKGSILTDRMFTKEKSIGDDLVLVGIHADDSANMAGGMVRKGDRLDIYSLDKDDFVCLLYSEAVVAEAFDQVGNPIPAGDTHTPALRVNVYLPRDMVEAFYELSYGNALRMVKIN